MSPCVHFSPFQAVVALALFALVAAEPEANPEPRYGKLKSSCSISRTHISGTFTHSGYGGYGGYGGYRGGYGGYRGGYGGYRGGYGGYRGGYGGFYRGKREAESDPEPEAEADAEADPALIYSTAAVAAPYAFGAYSYGLAAPAYTAYSAYNTLPYASYGYAAPAYTYGAHLIAKRSAEPEPYYGYRGYGGYGGKDKHMYTT